MTPAQRKKFQQALVKLQGELAKKGSLQIEPNRTSDAKSGGDEDEQPLNEMLQSIASSRNRTSDVILKRIAKALAKLRDRPEDFGLCESCEEDIAPARLNALPYADLCVLCQQKRDGPKGAHTRRKLTDYL